MKGNHPQVSVSDSSVQVWCVKSWIWNVFYGFQKSLPWKWASSCPQGKYNLFFRFYLKLPEHNLTSMNSVLNIWMLALWKLRISFAHKLIHIAWTPFKSYMYNFFVKTYKFTLLLMTAPKWNVGCILFQRNTHQKITVGHLNWDGQFILLCSWCYLVFR